MSILFLLVPDGFRDEEYAVPRRILLNAGLEVTTASAAVGPLRGKKGLVTAQVDITLDKVSAADYQGLVIAGGQPTYWYDETVLRLTREFAADGRLVAAICISGLIPAQAGVLRGGEYTVFPSPDALADARKHDAVYVDRPVVVSGNIITARDFAAAEEFGRAIVDFFSR
ncbi:MAG: DJ-1/PfpI family protein [Candidatus Margulisbacteria bacterium]|jgi:protease I|nr:DJ-1/PfpI family protein [Candidatus Margulisiibacteriota bacterium]